MMNVGSNFLKWTLIIINIIIFIFGVALVGVGGYMIAEKTYMEDLLGSTLFITGCSLLIAAGVVIVILSFFGFCGALKSNVCILYTYGTLLLLIFIVVMTGGIIAVVFKSDIENALLVELEKSMDKYDQDESAKEGWDVVQFELSCCGITGPSDWLPNIPGSCCDNKTSCIIVNAYKDGCMDEMKDELESNAKLLGGIGFGVAIFTLLAIISSCSLARNGIPKSGYKKTFEKPFD